MTKHILHKLLIGVVLLWIKHRQNEPEGYTEEIWYFYPSEDMELRPESIDMVNKRVVVTFNVERY